jgi:hypothetical protein
MGQQPVGHEIAREGDPARIDAWNLDRSHSGISGLTP